MDSNISQALASLEGTMGGSTLVGATVAYLQFQCHADCDMPTTAIDPSPLAPNSAFLGRAHATTHGVSSRVCNLRSPQPCMLFVGEKFESVPALRLARSLLLDIFKGEPVTSINLAGLDRVMIAYAVDDNVVSDHAFRTRHAFVNTPS